MVEAWQFIVDRRAGYFSALLTHIELSVAALFFAIVIAVPLGVWISGRRRAAITAIAAANIGRTLPSLAVLALVMPVLGTGFAPSLFALRWAVAAYFINLAAMPPGRPRHHRRRARHGHDGRRNCPQDRAAAGDARRLRRDSDRRQVQVVSGAVLAAYIGGGGLGGIITAGIAMMALPQLLVGAIPATLLSIGADRLFGWLQMALTPAGMRAP